MTLLTLLAVLALAGCASPPAPTPWPEGLIADQITPAPTPGELDDLLPQLPDADDGAKEVMPNEVPMADLHLLRKSPPAMEEVLKGAASVTTRICTMVPAPWPAPHVNLWPRWSCLCDPSNPRDVRLECS